jgi:hypothetical protein
VTEKSRATGWDITVYKIIESTCSGGGGGGGDDGEGIPDNPADDGFGDPFPESSFGGGGNEPGSSGPNNPEEIDFKPEFDVRNKTF